MTEEIYSFALTLAARPTDEQIERLFASGVDDCLIGLDGDVPAVEFERSASSLAEAVLSAEGQLRAAGFVLADSILIWAIPSAASE